MPRKKKEDVIAMKMLSIMARIKKHPIRKAVYVFLRMDFQV